MKNFQITGYVGQTPELKESKGTTFTSLRIAARTRTDEPDWFWVAVFGKLAGVVAEHVSKGMVVSVSGELRVNRYQDREKVELIAQKVDFFGNGKGRSASADDVAI